MNNKLITGINLEGIEAIENIESILEIEELDIIFVGLFDLSKALKFQEWLMMKKL